MNPALVIGLMTGLVKLFTDGKKIYAELGGMIDESVSDEDLNINSLKSVVERMKLKGTLPTDYKLPIDEE